VISPYNEATILRLFHAEKWRVGTIARQLSIHHSVVTRVLEQAGVPAAQCRQRRSMADPFIPFITETLKKYPEICASRIYQMVRERGYPGRPDHFRSIVARVRPPKPAQAYLRLKTLPGDQAQVDWAFFDKIKIGKAERPLMAFVMVLSWSRMIFLKFYLDCRIANLMRGHQDAFDFFSGVPRVILYDNPKNVVLERVGDAIRFHPTLLDFTGHYRYEPRPVGVARGNEKGRVERAIRYVRTSFFPARKWTDLDDLNQQALAWCTGEAADRACPEDTAQRVREAFAAEQPKLLPIPDNPYPTDERVETIARKTPYIRFDRNDYSIPHNHVGRTVVVTASLDRVKVLSGSDIIADHARSFDAGQQIEDQAHVAGLVAQKRHAREHRGLDRLARQVSNASDLLELVGRRGGNLGNVTARLLVYVDQYGAAAVESAVAEAIDRGTPHIGSVRFLLERRRRAQNRPVPIAIDLPDDPRVRDLSVRPHALRSYDEIKGVESDEAIDDTDSAGR
jgi:transposase